MRLKLLLSASCVTLLVAAAGPVAAQVSAFDRGRNVGVRDRTVDGYDAVGFRAGSFLVFPWAEGGLVWSDNPLAQTSNAESDTVLTLSGAIRAQSQWSRHYLQVFVDGALAQYGDHDDESNSEWGIGADGRLDVARGAYLSGAADTRSLVQPRSDASTPSDALEPVSYDASNVMGAASAEFGRVRLGGDVTWTSYEYDAVPTLFSGTISQDYRNEDIVAGGVRVDYAISPAVALYGVVRGNDRDYDLPPDLTDASDLNDVERDSSGWEAGLGLDFDLTHAVRGHVLLGYMSQDYDDPATPTIDGGMANAWVEWFPTQLTTVVVSADRSISDTGVGSAAGMLTSQIGARVDHELKRNLILWAAGAWAKDDYEGVDRTDKRFDAGAGADLKLNRLLAVRVSYQHYDRSSSGGGAGFDYTENRLGAVLVVHP